MFLSSEKGDDEIVPPLPKKLCLGAAPSTAKAGNERKVEAMIAALQAYVFTVLVCIYLNDSIHGSH